MTMNFFNKPKADDGGKRYRALIIVQGWLNGKGHLPKELIDAFHTLIPDLKKGAEDYEDM